MNLTDWLITRIATETGEASVDAHTPVYRYGVDSRMLALVIDAAERTHGLEADLDRISADQTITALAEALAPVPARTGD